MYLPLASRVISEYVYADTQKRTSAPGISALAQRDIEKYKYRDM